MEKTQEGFPAKTDSMPVKDSNKFAKKKAVPASANYKRKNEGDWGKAK